MKKLQMLILVVIGAAIGAAAFYFLYYQKTPSYSLFLAYRATQRSDLAAFEKRVDLDSVLDYAYEDIVKEAAQVMTLEEQRLTGYFFGLFKRPVVAGVKEMLREEIKKTRQAEAPPGDGEKAFKLPLQSPFLVKDIFDEVRPGKLDYRGTGRCEIDGGSARVETLLFDRELNKQIALIAVLQKQDGIWRLIRIEQLGAYLMQLREARTAAKSGK